MGRFFLNLLIVMLFTQTALLSAGVVEDAEEELKKLRREQGQVQVQVQVSTPVSPPSYSRGQAASPRRDSSQDARGNSRATPSRSTTKTGFDAQGRSGLTGFRPSEEEAISNLPRRERTHQDKKGYFFSFLAIVIFAFLVILASLFGRRVESEE